MKLDPSKRKPKKACPPPQQPVKYSHLCDIDKRTATGSAAWEARNSAGAKRVDVNRALHQLAGSHEAAQQIVAEATKGNKHQTIGTVQTRTLKRIVNKLQD